MDERSRVLKQIDADARRLSGRPSDWDGLVERAAEARVVLIGEATHGTHEFYASRAEITRRLIEEHDFTDVLVEADWPDAYRVNKYVRLADGDGSAEEALGDFERFPTWMWRNTEVTEFVEWLRGFNVNRAPQDRTGFWGMDLYSLHRSMESVIAYLDEVDPEGAERARRRYECFDNRSRPAEDPQSYGARAVLDLDASCQREVVEQLVELRSKASDYLRRDGLLARDGQFVAEQNARVAKNAESYYRAMFQADQHSWNVRDEHMFDTLRNIMQHRYSLLDEPRVVVWAHNSHLGDCRATDMSARGELNVGQLVREHFDDEAFLIGMTTYDGTVTAASNWGGEAERKQIRPARADSYEGLFHEVADPYFVLNLEDVRLARYLDARRQQRAIGVIYRPERELIAHYFKARLASQFDAVIHWDRTRALEPLELTGGWEEADDLPETYPWGL